MKILYMLLLACLIYVLPAFTQPDKSVYGISFTGFVKTDVMFDSRQTDALREGHFLLYPSAPDYDAFGNDCNAQPNFNILSIQTRLQGKITGSDALGAKTSGMIEGEFFGTSNTDASGFRLRHAFVKLDWETTSLLIGQHWHPMFVIEMFPGVVSFNTGAPFQPFSRNPQIRLTQNFGQLKLIAAALSQRDFQSDGPGGLSSTYLRNSVIPNLHVQAQYAQSGNIIGAGFDYKKLTPRLKTAKNVVAEATIGSVALLGYAKISLGPITVKAEGTTGENLSDLLMLGGYAVQSMDTTTGIENYSAIRSYSLWGEISTGKEFEFALFAGYSKNLGAEERLLGPIYGRGSTIDNLLRIAPRAVYSIGQSRFALEYEYTVAAYGTTNYLNKGKVENTKDLANARILFAVFYFF